MINVQALSIYAVLEFIQCFRITATEIYHIATKFIHFGADVFEYKVDCYVVILLLLSPTGDELGIHDNPLELLSVLFGFAVAFAVAFVITTAYILLL